MKEEVRQLKGRLHALSQEPPRDHRIGLMMKTRERSHQLYYERGEVVHVLSNDVLVLKMSGGSVVMEPASDWVTV